MQLTPAPEWKLVADTGDEDVTTALKWKLVVDTGDDDVTTAVSCSTGVTTDVATAAIAQSREVHAKVDNVGQQHLNSFGATTS